MERSTIFNGKTHYKWAIYTMAMFISSDFTQLLQVKRPPLGRPNLLMASAAPVGWDGGGRDAQADCLPSLVGTFLGGKYDMDWYLDIFGYSYWEPILFCFSTAVKVIESVYFLELAWHFEAVKTSDRVWNGWRMVQMETEPVIAKIQRQWALMPWNPGTSEWKTQKSWEQTANHPKWRKIMFRTRKNKSK